jgi:hypothetical protein
MFAKFAAFAVVALSAVACAADAGQGDDNAAVEQSDDELASQMCGGFAGIRCPNGSTCVITAKHPDASGTCKKTPAVEGQFCGGIANLQCPSGFDCKLAGNFPDAGGKCQKAVVEGQFCGGIANLQCPTGFNCKLAGNFPDAGGKCEKALCVQRVMCAQTGHFDQATCSCVPNVTCASVRCISGTHCVMRGINGGAVPVCIRN